MFGPSHYVPILRWTQAERFALRYLQPEDRKRITPLIELTPLGFKSTKTSTHFGKVFEGMYPTAVSGDVDGNMTEIHEEGKIGASLQQFL